MMVALCEQCFYLNLAQENLMLTNNAVRRKEIISNINS